MKYKFFAIFGFLALLSYSVIAQDTTESEYEEEIIEVIEEQPRAISARMTCTEINNRIAELREEIETDPDLESELNTMLARQRTQCTTKSKHRPVRNTVKLETKSEIVSELVEEEAPTAEPELSPEEIAAIEAEAEQQAAENLAKGLCPDGAKPNRFGCCAGERFKEVGPMQYACCPKEGDGDCFEPLKK